MPTVFRRGSYRFHFYASDGVEPRHVHVAREGADAKFCLDPDVHLARNLGFSAKELRDARAVVENELQALRDAWNGFFNP